MIESEYPNLAYLDPDRPSLVPVVDTRVLGKGTVSRRIPQHDWTRLDKNPPSKTITGGV
jgi:hypothetical protein